MWDHHQRAVDRWVEYAKNQPSFLAVIVAGSLTKGYATEASDVDGFIVVSDEEFERRKASGEIFWINTEFCDYEGGYIDAKCVSLDWLRQAADHGSEPARSAFTGALVPWSRVDGLPELCQNIVRYPEPGREDRMRRYIAQIEFGRWFVGEGARRDNPYMLALASSRLVLFCARLLLTHNRILYPYHKWLLRTLDAAPEKPEGIMEQIDSFARTPTGESAKALAQTVTEFREWPALGSEWPNIFLKDSEWNWLDHEPPIEDL